MADQVALFRRYFCNGQPTSTWMLNRSKELFGRIIFDADCIEFHNSFVEYGLDFAFCWASVHGEGNVREAKRIYTEIVERTGVDHLYELGGEDLGGEPWDSPFRPPTP